jgi:hypothetical protein
MNIQASAAGLAGLTKDLLRVWDETKSQWRDAKAVEFEQRHLLPLLDAVDTLAVVADKLEKAVHQARSDCA